MEKQEEQKQNSRKQSYKLISSAFFWKVLENETKLLFAHAITKKTVAIIALELKVYVDPTHMNNVCTYVYFIGGKTITSREAKDRRCCCLRKQRET